MTEKNGPEIRHRSGECLTEDQIDNYIQKSLSSKKRREIEAHLDSCDLCFRRLTMILNVSFAPTTESERIKLKEAEPCTIDEQVSKILSYDRKLNHNRGTGSLWIRFKDILINFIKLYFFTTLPRWRPILAYSIVTILIIGTMGGFRQMNQIYHLTQAKSLIERNYRIDAENDLQLAGQFAPGMGQLMDSESAEPYQVQAKAHLHQILRHKPHHTEASMLLTKLYIIERKFTQAESLFDELQNQGVKSAPLFNDLAIFLVEKGDTSQAINSLRQAIAIDARLPEPYYNLGFLFAKIKSDSGRTYFKKYTEIEKDSRWQDVIPVE